MGEVEANNNNFLTFRRRPHAVVYVQLHMHMSMCMYRRTYKSMQACLFSHTFIYISAHTCVCACACTSVDIFMYGHMCKILSFSFHVCSYMYLYVSRYPEVGETWKCTLAQQTYFKDTIHFLKISMGEHFF